MSDQLTGRGSQCRQQSPLRRGQTELLVAPRGAIVGEVQDEVGCPHCGQRLGLGACPACGCPYPSQELVHAKGFGHVVIGSGVERLDLVVGFLTRRQDDHGNHRGLADPSEHVDAVHVRQPEVQHDDVRSPLSHDLQCGAAVAGRLDVVLTRPQVNGQGAHDPRLVVDDQDERHEVLPPFNGRSFLAVLAWVLAWGPCLGPCLSPCRVIVWVLAGFLPGHCRVSVSGRSMTMVNPPPGVSSALSVPSIASVSPRATASPRPTPSPRSVSPIRRNGANICSFAASGTPIPRSTTRIWSRWPMTLPLTTTSWRPGECLSAFSRTFASTRSSRPASARNNGRSSGNQVRTREACSPRVEMAGLITSSRCRS